MLTQLFLSVASAHAAALPAETIVSADGATFAIRAAQLHVGDGSVIEKGVVLVRDGRIEQVGAELELPADTAVIEHPGHLAPGWIALRDFAGTKGENYDSTRAVMDSASLAHAFDGGHSDFKVFAAAGVTAALLAPERGFVGGLTAVVKPTRVLAENTHLFCSLASSTFAPNVEPTSFAGALAELERRFVEPSGSFALVASGELPMMLRVESRHELLRAIGFAQQLGINGSLVGAGRAGELAAEIKAAGMSVVFPSFAPGVEERSLKSVVLLAQAGVPFGFCLDSPGNDPAMLRVSAAACLRYGLEPASAMRALTLDAATIAGVAQRIGSLEAGKDADLVLWSGDPLDLGSKLVATYIDGKRVFGAKE
jgi:imidazolonepropionase-like amidohydrolase